MRTEEVAAAKPTQLSVYLDWCVIDAMRKGEHSELREAIDFARSIIPLHLPYSPTHITEATRVFLSSPEREQLIESHLGFLGDLTRNLHLNVPMGRSIPEPSTQHPRNLRQVYSDADWPYEILRSIATNAEIEKMARSRELMDTNPRELNNLGEADIIEVLTEKLRAFDARARETDPKYRAEVEARGVQPSLESWIETIRLQLASINVPMTDDFRMMLYFLLIDLLGYHPDIRLDESISEKIFNVIRDAQHAYIASFCHFFVTRDQRLIRKANAVYMRMGKLTPIIHANEFAPLLVAISRDIVRP